jgi:hypothetical protein
MDDNFPNQLRKQFSIDRVLENPGFVAAVYVNERDHAADIIEDQQKRIEQLELALLKIANLDTDPEFGTPPLETAKAVARKAL